MPGEYTMFSVTLQFDQDFAGGEIVVVTQPASGEDPRPGVCEPGQVNTRVANVTVEGGVVEPQDLTGEITFTGPTEDGIITFVYFGDEDVTLKVNGEAYNGEEIQLVDGDNAFEVVAEAEGYNPLEREFVITWTAPVVPQDLTGEITVSEPDEAGYVEIGYNGPEEVVMNVTINGEDAEAPYQLAEGENTIVVTVEAEGYNTLEQTFVRTYTIPAPAEFEGEIVVSEPDENGVVTVSYNGPEDVLVTVVINGEEAEAPYQLAEGENEIVVTVEAPGYEPMTQTFIVNYTAPEPPVVYTEVPVVTFEITPDAYIFTATGVGEVKLYVNDEQVENPCTIERPEAERAEPMVVRVYATAQEPGKEMSTSDVLEITIEPKAGEVSQDIMLVLVDQFGNEHPVALNVGDDLDVSTTVTLDYYPYGQFEWNPYLTDDENEANRPAVPFYFIINGKRYGAEEGNVATVLGYAMQNPLTEEGEGFYTVPVGYSYTLGVAKKDGAYYVYAAVSTQVGVDELNANKTVAGVRYFNMAGQEMQEANGMTIVVTTYTDGTTSAVKVMK
jgi:hypothetical protein